MNILLRLSIRPTYWRIAVILPGRILWRTYSRVEYPTPDEAVRRCLAGLVGSSHQQHEPCPRAAGQSKTGQQHVENDHAERVQGEDHKIVSCRAQSGWSPSVNPKSRTAQTEKNRSDDQGRNSIKLVTHSCPLTSVPHYDPNNRDYHCHCGNPDDDRFHLLPPPGCIQPQTDQRPKECRHGHAEPQHRLPAIEGDEAMQHGLHPQIFDYQPCRPPEEHAAQVCQQNHVRALFLPHRGSNYGQYESEGRKGEDREKIIHPRPLPPVRVRAAWWGWL